jgi:hypothetical protein
LLSDPDDGADRFCCACERGALSFPPVAFGADWLVVAPGRVLEGTDWAFCADDGEFAEDVGCEAGEFALGWLCAAGGEFDPSFGDCFGDCAMAPVPISRPMAVVINKRCFMFHSSRLI